MRGKGWIAAWQGGSFILPTPRHPPHPRDSAEAKASYRRRGGQPLVVESDLKLARFLAGLHVRREVGCWVSCFAWSG